MSDGDDTKEIAIYRIDARKKGIDLVLTPEKPSEGK